MTALVDRWQQRTGAAAPKGVPGIDIFDRPDPTPILDDWLHARQAGFDAWATRYRGTWDFSPDSIDAVVAVMREETPTVEDINDYAAHADFLDGACWYLGEIFRRAQPSLWVYRDWEAQPCDPAIICFSVQRDDDTDYKTPFSTLHLCLKRDANRARSAFERWATAS